MPKNPDGPSTAASTAASRLAWKRVTRWVLAAQVLGFLISGIVLGYSPLAQLESPSQVQMQVRHIATIIHGSMAWLFCVLIGHTLWRHVDLAWKWPNKGMAWYLGTLSLAIVITLSVTGLSLLYGATVLRGASQVIHWWLGLAWPVMLLAHSLRIRKSS
jgi:hypothetical protein